MYEYFLNLLIYMKPSINGIYLLSERVDGKLGKLINKWQTHKNRLNHLLFFPEKPFSYDFEKHLIKHNLENYFKNQNVSCHKRYLLQFIFTFPIPIEKSLWKLLRLLTRDFATRVTKHIIAPSQM